MRMAIELFNAYLDGVELTAEQGRMLSEWVKESPENARTLVMLTQIHESLDSRMCVPRMLEDLTRIGDPEVRDEISDSLDAFFHKVEETSPLYVASAPPTKKAKLWLIGSGWAAAAALLLVVLWSSVANQDRPVADPGPRPPADRQMANGPPSGVDPVGQDSVRPAELVATVVELIDAAWVGQEGKKRGAQVLQGETLRLERGIASLRTTVGHAIVIEAPAEVVVESPQQLAMEYGKAVGRVGVHGGSLEFSTPTATIRDLGTEFGVEVTTDRQTRVAVFEGAIALSGAQAAPIEVAAGLGRSVSAAGEVLEETPLPHDREFVRLDEVDLRVASRQGDDEAKALATYYALVRSGKLLIYQGFHAPSRGLERTIGLGDPALRATAPVVMGRDLHPESILASGGVRIDNSGFVFLPVDTRPTSPLARRSLLDDRGIVGKAGTELWMSWRAQLHGSMRDIKQYGGLSLTLSDTDDSLDTFFGRVHSRDYLGVQFNFEAKGDRPKFELDMDPERDGVQSADADDAVHRWVVHLRFTAKEDHIRVWFDVPLSAIEGHRPNFSGSRDGMEFDRVRMAISDNSDAWTFDEVMVAATLDDLAAAERILTPE